MNNSDTPSLAGAKTPPAIQIGPKLESDLLGERCPFGAESSPKHMSTHGECPDLRESSRADRQISDALRAFGDFLIEDRSDWRPAEIEAYDQVGLIANKIDHSAPATFGEIFPLEPGRHGEAILEQVADSDSIIARYIAAAHEKAVFTSRSHRLAARAVMSSIGRDWDAIAAEDGVGELALVASLERFANRRNPAHALRAPSAYGAERGIALSAGSIRSLSEYQVIQERPESEADVHHINTKLAARTKTIEELIGIHITMVADLQRWFDADPERWATVRAFREIALVNADGKVVPNSRFLKILMHNWGEFIASHPVANIADVVSFCTSEARLNRIFEQNILVLRRHEKVWTLFGIAHRSCPAAASLGSLISRYSNPKENKQ